MNRVQIFLFYNRVKHGPSISSSTRRSFTICLISGVNIQDLSIMNRTSQQPFDEEKIIYFYHYNNNPVFVHSVTLGRMLFQGAPPHDLRKHWNKNRKKKKIPSLIPTYIYQRLLISVLRMYIFKESFGSLSRKDSHSVEKGTKVLRIYLLCIYTYVRSPKWAEGRSCCAHWRKSQVRVDNLDCWPVESPRVSSESRVCQTLQQAHAAALSSRTWETATYCTQQHLIWPYKTWSSRLGFGLRKDPLRKVA